MDLIHILSVVKNKIESIWIAIPIKLLGIIISIHSYFYPMNLNPHSINIVLPVRDCNHLATLLVAELPNT